MKKFFFLFVMCLVTFTMQAQRCAVLEFKAGAGISQADVDGIADIFITYFQPAGYTMVERTQIDRVIDEQGFQRSNMTESQMVRIGKILNVSKVVVGRVNVVMRQYNVDVRVINVETGTIAAKEGQQFSATSYRATMKSIAQNLAAKIAIKSGPTVSATSPVDKKATVSSSSKGYVDLGLPSGTKWKEYNESGFYTYGEAISQYGNKLPSVEQIDELVERCQWTWIGEGKLIGYRITGANNKSIFLPAAGYYHSMLNEMFHLGEGGYYWSSTPDDSYEKAWNLNFVSDSRYTISNNRSCNFSVRLVQNP